MSGERENLYWTYGLRIASEIPLADLLCSTSADVDVSIRYGSFQESMTEKELAGAEVFERSGCRILVTETAMLVDWDRVGRFLVRSGSEVLVDRAPDALEEDLHPFLTGPILAILLHQRGCFVLHSSSVLIDDAAVVFLGSKGDGKSTLAAHLQVRGNQLVSDDLVPISFDGDHVVTYSGFPRVKLYEDSLKAVGHRPDDFPLIHRFVEKRSFKYSRELPVTPVEICAVYVLEESETVGLDEIHPADAFIELTKNSFLNRFLAAMNSQRDHFQHCQRLVNSVPIMRLCRPHDFVAMDEVCSLVERNAASLSMRSNA